MFTFDYMLDIETLNSNMREPVITSICILKFDLQSGQCFDHFQFNIDPTLALTLFPLTDFSTIEWWLTQDINVFQKSLSGGVKTPEQLEEKLIEFTEFFRENTVVQHAYVWGNGPTFDITGLEALFDAFGMQPPWKYQNINCCRTVERLAGMTGLYRDDFEFEGNKHDPRDDCRHQIKYIHGMISKLTGNAK